MKNIYKTLLLVSSFLMTATTAIAADQKFQRSKTTLPTATNMSYTGQLCSAGFQQSKHHFKSPGIYDYYECTGTIPPCLAQKQIASQHPLVTVIPEIKLVNGSLQNRKFRIRANWKSQYGYSCSTPQLDCLSVDKNSNDIIAPAPNLSTSLKRIKKMGDKTKVTYVCYYNWPVG